MQQENNLFREMSEIIALFKNASKQHITDPHLRIYHIFWWNILLRSQLSILFLKENMFCQSI